MDERLRNLERYCAENPSDKQSAFQLEIRKWDAGLDNKFPTWCRVCASEDTTDDLRLMVRTPWWDNGRIYYEVICNTCVANILALIPEGVDHAQYIVDFWSKSDSLAAQIGDAGISVEYDDCVYYNYNEHDWHADSYEVTCDEWLIRPEFISHKTWDAIVTHAKRAATYLLFNAAY